MVLACFHPLRGQACIEDARDCLGLGDFANHTKLPSTVGTHTQVDTEHPVEPGHPGHGRRGRVVRVLALLGADGRGVPGYDEVTVSGVRGEQAVISDEMGARSRHQGGETSDEVLGFEQHVSGAI